MENQELIKVENITLNFGGNTVLDNVSFNAKNGEILGLIGPNVAGKTCMLNCITMFYRPQVGQMFFEGKGYYQQQNPPDCPIRDFPQEVLLS